MAIKTRDRSSEEEGRLPGDEEHLKPGGILQAKGYWVTYSLRPESTQMPTDVRSATGE